MAKPHIHDADRKALSVTPAQFREQQIRQLSNEVKYYQRGVVTSLLVASIGLPVAAFTGSYLLYSIGGIGFVNVFYMRYKQRQTGRKLEDLRRKHEMASQQQAQGK